MLAGWEMQGEHPLTLTNWAELATEGERGDGGRVSRACGCVCVWPISYHLSAITYQLGPISYHLSAITYQL